MESGVVRAIHLRGVTSKFGFEVLDLWEAVERAYGWEREREIIDFALCAVVLYSVFTETLTELECSSIFVSWNDDLGTRLLLVRTVVKQSSFKKIAINSRESLDAVR